MDAGELRRLWDEAGGAAERPRRGAAEGSGRGAGLLGLQSASDPEALPGAALVALGLPLNGDPAWPGEVRRASQGYADWLPALGGALRAADYGDVEVVDDDPAVAFMQAHERLADIVAAGASPLVLGGDALVSVPVLQVLSGKLRGRLGVVAFSPVCDIAPEPLYAAGSRWARALELGVLAPSNLVLVGGRDDPAGAPARAVLDRLGATRFSLGDVLHDGAPAVAQEALEIAAAGAEAVYLSVDLGVVGGLGDPVGLEVRELVAGVRVVSAALLAAADICGGPPPGLGGGPAAQAGGRPPGDGPGPAARVAARVAAEIAAGVARRLA